MSACANDADKYIDWLKIWLDQSLTGREVYETLSTIKARKHSTLRLNEIAFRAEMKSQHLL